MINKCKNISIVIPTLGSCKLHMPLASIQNSTVNVFEVIIVLPISYKVEIDLTKYSDINIVTHYTKKGGQVFQRSEGFKIAKGDYILQLDDDIEFNKLFIENILNSLISLPKFSCVSPLMTNHSCNSVYRGSFTLFSRLFYSLLYFNISLKEGCVNSFGKSMGVTSLNKILEVDWLPGGCIIHHKENMILYNYFPFNSKAFMEDLIHSYYLKLNGIKLYIDSNIFAKIVEPRDELNSNKLFSDKISEFKIRKYYFKLTGRSIIKFYWTCFIDSGITIVKYIYLKIFEK